MGRVHGENDSDQFRPAGRLFSIVLLSLEIVLKSFNMEPEYKKHLTRLETHEEWKNRIEREFKARKELEKAKLETKKQLLESSNLKNPRLRLKKERKNVKLEKDSKESRESSSIKDPRLRLKKERKNVKLEKDKNSSVKDWLSKSPPVDIPAIRVKKEPLEANQELEMFMSPIDMDNEIEYLLSQEASNSKRL